MHAGFRGSNRRFNSLLSPPRAALAAPLVSIHPPSLPWDTGRSLSATTPSRSWDSHSAIVLLVLPPSLWITYKTSSEKACDFEHSVEKSLNCYDSFRHMQVCRGRHNAVCVYSIDKEKNRFTVLKALEQAS
jgi:hypothetical protein